MALTMRLRKPNTARRGFTVIGILMALVIILILSGHYLFPGSDGEAPLAQTSIDRARDVSYTANKQVLYSQVQIFKMNYPNVPVTLEAMQRANVTIPQCPECQWILMEDGEIFSTLEPPPDPQGGQAGPGAGAPQAPAAGPAGQMLQQIQQQQSR